MRNDEGLKELKALKEMVKGNGSRKEKTKSYIYRTQTRNHPI